MFRALTIVAVQIGVCLAAPCAAGIPETLTTVAFATPQKAAALQKLNEVLVVTGAQLARAPADRDALLQHSIALAYRAQLGRSIGDAKEARHGFETLIGRNPADAEALMALASWNLNSVADLGGFIASTVLGASRKQGEALLARALAAGGDRALFPAYAALLRTKIAPDDLAVARQLAERAARSRTPTALDLALKQRAVALLPVLRAGDSKQAEVLARKLLPLGDVTG